MSPGSGTRCVSAPDALERTTEHAHGASGPGCSPRTRTAIGLCKRCREEDDVPCPGCGEPMPAGGGNQCERCYLESLADQRTTFNQAAFTTPNMAWQFMEFGTWLKSTRGPEKAAQKIHRFLPFFLEIERQWGGSPQYANLVSHFGATRLRSVLLAMRWMEESGRVRPDAQVREEQSDRRRIEATLARCRKALGRGRSWRATAKSWTSASRQDGRARVRCGWRLRRRQDCSKPQSSSEGQYRTRRLLDGYLKKTPGQRAAVSGFVSHLRVALNTELKLPPYDRQAATRGRRRKLREELLDLMRTSESGSEVDQRWIAAALAYFHELPRKAADGFDVAEIVLDRGGMTIQIGEQRYWIPPRSGTLVEGHA